MSALPAFPGERPDGSGHVTAEGGQRSGAGFPGGRCVYASHRRVGNRCRRCGQLARERLGCPRSAGIRILAATHLAAFAGRFLTALVAPAGHLSGGWIIDGLARHHSRSAATLVLAGCLAVTPVFAAVFSLSGHLGLPHEGSPS